MRVILAEFYGGPLDGEVQVLPEDARKFMLPGLPERTRLMKPPALPSTAALPDPREYRRAQAGRGIEIDALLPLTSKIEILRAAVGTVRFEWFG